VTAVLYVGHSTVLIEVDGVRLLTDPLLRRRVGHLRRDSQVDLGSLQNLDAVLISHAHRDHLDIPSLRRLDRGTTAIVPRGLRRLVRGLGFNRVVEVDEGEALPMGPVEVRATHAEHDERRPPFSRVSGPALGYVISGSSRIYFAGDTALFQRMDGLVSDLDLALVPIWGWGPTLGRGEHLDPASAAQALSLLRPRMAVPIHWGTYRPLQHGLRREPAFLREPAESFVREAAAAAPEVEVRVLKPGERLDF
jgi:L-ascorbate metabolism protein UlaG (beta-lactamase superfamily)